MRDDVAVVILAGGEGRRIGGGKPLRRLAGERLVDRALRTARDWSDLIAVAVREAGQVEGVSASIITDEPDFEGPLAGLVAALRFAARSDREFVLTIPADTPCLPSDLLDRLCSEIGDRSCALASSGGQVHPVCALWRADVVHRVGLCAAGPSSLKAFAALVGFRAVEWPCEPVDPFFNINTTNHMVQAERRLKA